MTSFRIRILITSLVALVLLASGGFWIASNRPDQTASGFSSLTESSKTTEVSTTLGSFDPGATVSGGDRVDPEVRANLAATKRTEVVVVFDAQISGTDDEKRAQVRSGIDSITSSLPSGTWELVGETPTVPVANLMIDDAALSALEVQSVVEHIDSALHEFYPAELSDQTLADGEMGVSATTATMGVSGLAGSWAAGFKGAGTTIAVVDTGVQTDHPFLMNGTVQKTIGEACFASFPGFTSPCPGDVAMGTNDPSKVGAGAPCPVDLVTNGQKECQHGTHVAGIAAGGDGSGTVASGIAPEASLVAVQIFSYKYSTNRITADTGDIDAALQWLYNRRADFPGLVAVNLSVGDSQKYMETTTCDGSNPSTRYYVQQLLDVGIATVVAAGNNSWTDGVSSPGCLSNVVTVSALSGGSGVDQRASYSNVGQAWDAEHTDGFNILFAPGTLNSSVPCDGYAVLNGTSMATPAVTGVIAALHQPTVAASFALLRNTGTAVTGFSAPSVKMNLAIAGLPGPPRSVAGIASGSQVAVSWTAPVVNAGTVTGYTVTAVPGGRSCSTSGLTCTVTLLDPTKSYVFTVNATGTGGVGAGESSASIPMPFVPEIPTDYVPLDPVRLLDTRSVSTGASTIDGNDLGCGAVGQGQDRTLMVEGRGGVPTSGVDAVAVNITVVAPTASNFVTVYPSGTARPNASNINFVAGQTIPNMAIVRVGTDGRISVYNEGGLTQIIIDVVGWFPDGSDYTATPSPQRFLDTRSPAQGGGPTIDGQFSGFGALWQEETIYLPIAGRGSVPARGLVGAVALNVTVVGPTASNYLTVFPAGTALPTASNLNFSAGQTIANMVIAKVSPEGNIAIYNNAGMTQVVVDVVGYFPVVSEYTAIVPQRFVDTRSCGSCTTVDGLNQGGGAIPPGGSLTVDMTGRGPNPSSPDWIPSSGVGAVALNVTVVGSTGSNYLTVFPAGGAVPKVSNLNFLAGQTIPNMVIVKLGVGGIGNVNDGKITLYNNGGSTPVLVDVVGWFPN